MRWEYVNGIVGKNNTRTKVNNLKIHNFPELQELCVHILIKFFITTFNLFICVLETKIFFNKKKEYPIRYIISYKKKQTE